MRHSLALAVLVTLALLPPPLHAEGQSRQRQTYGIGRPATAEEIAGWDIDVRADGKGLLPGKGSVADGEALFAARCAVCHGEKGQGKPADRLVGGVGTLAAAKPVRTVGSFWPYATTLFDYIHRAMPFDAPQSLTADQVYAVSAYILYLNDLVPRDAVLDAASRPKVQMPNRNGFITEDPREFEGQLAPRHQPLKRHGAIRGLVSRRHGEFYALGVLVPRSNAVRRFSRVVLSLALRAPNKTGGAVFAEVWQNLSSRTLCGHGSSLCCLAGALGPKAADRRWTTVRC